MSKIDEVVGRKLRALREAAGISQAGLARIANLPQQELAAAEQGLRRLSAERLFLISGALKVPVSRLLAQEPSPPASENQGAAEEPPPPQIDE